ncbi:MAG: ATP-dependent 6-phosphofructokinase [Victivallales bacterium]|nr:ATP-dependent 6-phosphofructokinase [Victivallales bacterium]
MSRHIGVLTSGGDCPGLNAAIRGLGKSCIKNSIEVTGFLDGFRGVAFDRSMKLKKEHLTGLLTDGGTILGTSRDKPHKMPVGGKNMNMISSVVETYQRHHLDALVCIGGGGTQKNALLLKKAGLNILTLPKTIDNDIYGTDVSFGFDTAVGIATEAIDRLHSTATSHHRNIIVETMGHRAGWLALGAGTAGGADVVLIPEIPYSIEKVVEAIRIRRADGKRFSIIAVAEGAISIEDKILIDQLLAQKKAATSKSKAEKFSGSLEEFHRQHVSHTVRLTDKITELTGQESRLTILGHLQRGGSPSAADRLLATRLGAAAAELIAENRFGFMVAIQGDSCAPVPLEDVAGRKKLVPHDHQLVCAARLVGTSFGA